LTLGNFDGIHRGHQALLRRVVDEARGFGARSAVLTFEPHPLKVLRPREAPRLLLPLRDKLEILAALEIDVVLVQRFDSTFANMEARDFVGHYLGEALNVRKLWIGKDLRFGKARAGKVEDMIRWGAEAGFAVDVFEPVEEGGTRISSSRVRSLVEQGEVEGAASFLGRYHFLGGRVVPGRRRGRQLGFPTANIATRAEVLPYDGIYASFLEIDGRPYPSVTSVGRNPTFGEGPRTIETYVLDYSGNLYQRRVKLFFVKRIRSEEKFSSPDLLVSQINQDVSDARQILKRAAPPSCRPVPD
jgi:riboflavin kinase/FMN adenylyltransferase